MAVPSVPPPIAQLGARRFSFYPAILNIQHNEWIYQGATWSEVLVRNTSTEAEISVPRRYLGEISLVDEPVVIVGLTKELEYREGLVCPAERRVIEMPRAVNESVRPRPAAALAPVVGIRIEDSGDRRLAKFVLAGVALGVAGCVLAISLYRGGMNSSRIFYTPTAQGGLSFTPHDDYAAVVRVLGPASETRWTGRYQVLCYPKRGLYIILRDGRYAGAMDQLPRF